MKKLILLFFLLSFFKSYSQDQDLIITDKNDSLIGNITEIQNTVYGGYQIILKTIKSIEIIDFENVKLVELSTKKFKKKFIDYNKWIDKCNKSAGDELIVKARHEYIGIILSILGAGISAVGVNMNNSIVYSGFGISLIGFVLVIESISHIAKAGKKLNHPIIKPEKIIIN